MAHSCAWRGECVRAVADDEWVGASHMIGNQVTIVWLHVWASGKPLQQYTHVKTKNCHSCYLFAKCCSDATTDVPRGFTQEELTTILFQMRRSGYAQVQASLRSMTTQRASHDVAMDTEIAVV